MVNQRTPIELRALGVLTLLAGGDAFDRVQGIEKHVEEFLAAKLAAQPDSEEIKKIKGLIRETEARAAARYCGVKVT